MTSSALDRASLRATLRARRRSFVVDNQPVFPALPQLMDMLASARCIGGYAPLRDEPDVLPLLARLAESDVTLALPHFVNRESPMRFRLWRPGDELDISPFRFQQPLTTCADVTPDCFLVPILGFDRRGNRLGQGAGHYDRYLARHRQALKVGIAWTVQECDAIPVEAWDVPLDVICTQNELIKAQKG